jgi:hypothetical protein
MVLYATLAAILFLAKKLYINGKISIGGVSTFLLYILTLLW